MYYVKLFHIISYLILITLDTGALLNITLDGDAKLAQSHREGHYTLASTAVNGKKTWIHDQGSNVIWYDKELNNWKIGTKKNLGTTTCSLYSTNDTRGPEEAITWKYWNDYEWISTSNIFGSPSMY